MSIKINVLWWWLKVEKITLVLSLGGVLIMYISLLFLSQQQNLAVKLWTPFNIPSMPALDFKWQALTPSQLTQRIINHFSKPGQNKVNQSIQFTQTDTRLDLSLHLLANQLNSLYKLPVTPGWVLTDVQGKLVSLNHNTRTKVSEKNTHKSGASIMDEYLTLHLSWQVGQTQGDSTLYPDTSRQLYQSVNLSKAFFADTGKAPYDGANKKVVNAHYQNNHQAFNASKLEDIRYLGYLSDLSKQTIGIWLAFNEASILDKSGYPIHFISLGQHYDGWQIIAADANKAVIKKGSDIKWLPLCKALPCLGDAPTNIATSRKVIYE